jgi:hypothetical protein
MYLINQTFMFTMLNLHLYSWISTFKWISNYHLKEFTALVKEFTNSVLEKVYGQCGLKVKTVPMTTAQVADKFMEFILSFSFKVRINMTSLECSSGIQMHNLHSLSSITMARLLSAILLLVDKLKYISLFMELPSKSLLHITQSLVLQLSLPSGHSDGNKPRGNIQTKRWWKILLLVMQMLTYHLKQCTLTFHIC